MLQRMQTDPALRDVSHLVLDEIHERDVISDFVITILKDIIQKVCLKYFYLFIVYVMVLSVA
jgi:HrpA-like RNA helicase